MFRFKYYSEQQGSCYSDMNQFVLISLLREPGARLKKGVHMIYEFHPTFTKLAIALSASIARKSQSLELTMGLIMDIISHWWLICDDKNGNEFLVSMSSKSGYTVWSWDEFELFLGGTTVNVTNTTLRWDTFGQGIPFGRLFHMYGKAWQRKHFVMEPFIDMVQELLV
jgi:hypothetical protein